MPPSFQVILDHLPVMVGHWNRDLVNTYANAAHLNGLGLRPEDIQGRHMRDVFGEVVFLQVLHHVAAVLQGETCQYEQDVVTSDGNRVHQVTLLPEMQQGKAEGFFVLVSDITGRVNLEQQLRDTQRELQAVTDHVPALMGSWDTQGRCRFINQQALDWYGLQRADVLGQHISQVIGEELYQQNLLAIEGVLSGHRQDFERHIVHPLHGERFLQFAYLPDLTPEGTVAGFFVLVTDITSRKRMEMQLQEQRERARITVQAIGDAVIIINAEGRIDFMNLAAERLTGTTSLSSRGARLDQGVQLLEESTLQPLVLPGLAALDAWPPVTVLPATAQLRSRDGTLSPVEGSLAPIRTPDGSVLGAVVVLRDVTASRLSHSRMLHLAQHDPLTGLANRMLLVERMEQALQEAQLSGEQFAVVFMDLDHFKHINDTLGHHLGDGVLKRVAERLQHTTRSSDTVSRQGGDEFVLLLRHVNSREAARQGLEHVLRSVRLPYQLEGQSLICTFSIGVALFPEDGMDVDGLFRNADVAMYQAKRLGRNQMQFFSPALLEQQEQLQQLTQSLAQALQGGEFTLLYQPRVHLPTGQVVGVEVLLRWKKPGGELLRPEAFLGLAKTPV